MMPSYAGVPFSKNVNFDSVALINIILTKLTEYFLFEIISLLSPKNLIKIPGDNYKNYYFQN